MQKLDLCVWFLVVERQDSGMPTGESMEQPGKEVDLFWCLYTYMFHHWHCYVLMSYVLSLFQSRVNWRMRPVIALQEFVLIPELGIGCSVKHASDVTTAYVQECLFRGLKKRISDFPAAAEPLPSHPFH